MNENDPEHGVRMVKASLALSCLAILAAAYCIWRLERLQERTHHLISCSVGRSYDGCETAVGIASARASSPETKTIAYVYKSGSTLGEGSDIAIVVRGEMIVEVLNLDHDSDRELFKSRGFTFEVR